MEHDFLFNLMPDLWIGSFLCKESYTLELSEGGKNLFEVKASLERNIFAQAKIPVNDLKQVKAVTGLGFNLIDTNIIYTKKINPVEHNLSRVKVRHALHIDMEALAVLAHNNFIHSRFHLDPNIENSTAAKIKAEWVKNFFDGKRGNALLVAESDAGEVVGLNQLIFQGDVLIIDLIAVDKEFQGQGVGTELIRAAQHFFPQFRELHVGTQISNAPSISLYEKMGFFLKQSKYVFHYHGRFA